MRPFCIGGVMPDTAAVILAAGQGKRMHSATPKVLHRIAGRPMIDYVVTAVRESGVTRVVVVVGHGADAVEAAVGGHAKCVRQMELRGTADAVLQARPLLQGDARIHDVLIAHGDCPLLTPSLFGELVQRRRETGAMIALVATPADDPRGYGRVIRDADGRVSAIVEEASASEKEREIREINAGVYSVDASWLWEHLPSVKPSPSGEYYLTDLVALAVSEGSRVYAIEAPMTVTAGVNDRAQLAMAEEVIRERIRRDLMVSGVTLMDPRTIYIDAGVKIGTDSIVYPGTFIEGSTVIGTRCRIGPHARIVDSRIGSDVTIQMSVVESAEVGDRVQIGPFAHLRPGATIEADVELGNYAEVKNSRIGAGTRMHHFSYIGDADVGEGVNIGAGTITTNFDSESGVKNRTVVEDGVSLGSDTMLVAPVTVGKDAMTGAGAVVTHDVEPGTVVVGVPARPLRRRRMPPA